MADGRDHGRGGRREAPAMLRAHKLVELKIADDPSTWERLGFTVSKNPMPGGPPFVQIGHVTIQLLGIAGAGLAERGILAWGFESSPAHTGDFAFKVDSLATTLISTRDEDRLALVDATSKPSVHKNGVTSIDHIVITTLNSNRTVGMFAMLGIHPRRVLNVRGMKGYFFKTGDVVIEMLDVGGSGAGDDKTTMTTTDAPTMRGFTQGLNSQSNEETTTGAKFWGITFVMTDEGMDKVKSEWGSELVRGPRPARQGEGRRIFTLDHEKAGSSVNMAFITPKPGKVDKEGGDAGGKVTKEKAVL
ncbi:hypothetical protein HDU76_002642 [Blyttiomyces sp. JEL0837]|nr:hypothetical protein HDU76_002642 [Blyttiomyces sp. JEL0837]